MKQLYTIMQKNYNTQTVILDSQLENAHNAKSIFPNFTSSFIKLEQFDFSLLVNGKSGIERKVFPSIL